MKHRFGQHDTQPTVIPDHGGNLAAIMVRFPDAPRPWYDLSTGINPWPYPVPRLPLDSWSRLPDADTAAALRAAAAEAYGVPDPECVVAAPGSQALIQLLPRLRPPSRVAVLGPTYAEHALCWRAAGHAVIELDAISGLEAPDIDVAVVVNPNNPDGRQHSPVTLCRLAEGLAARRGWLVVDEAFGEVVPELSMAGATDTPGLIVLRSFGKFFGLAGLRLGFALTAPALAARVRAAVGPWAVSGPACALAPLALADVDWIDTTRARLTAAAEELDHLLSVNGLEVVGGTSLFRLGRSQHAAAVFTALAKAGVVVRRFDRHPHWLRFGLPPDSLARTRMERVLARLS
ncbi:Threonine-phosphate decarboxylase [uncultured Gammaproteobacteria bacterium]